MFLGKKVFEEMLAVAKAGIGDSLPETLKYVEEELKKLAKEIAKVETSRLIGKIDQESARLLTIGKSHQSCGVEGNWTEKRLI